MSIQDENSEASDPQKSYDNPPKKTYNYQKYDRYQRDRPEQLQPQAQSVGKHWYDEYPVEDRRKQIEEGLKERRTKDDFGEPEQYEKEPPQNGYPHKNEEFNYEGHQKYSNYEPMFLSKEQRKSQDEFNPTHFKDLQYKYSQEEFNQPQNIEGEFKNQSPRFENEQLNDSFENKELKEFGKQKHQSRSYNRNLGIHKRAFVNHQQPQNELREPTGYYEEKQFGRSASHGFERNFIGK